MGAVRRTFYTVLGVADDASREQIKAAWKRKAKETHPDANPDDAGALERFKRVSRAYEVLSDPPTRARYDDWLAQRRLPRCRACGEPVATGEELHLLCGLGRPAREQEAQRVPKTSPYQQRMEAEYGWVGDPANFDEMMGRAPEDYSAMTGQVSADQLLQALLAEAALRSCRTRGTPSAKVSVEISVNPELRVVLDEDGIQQMREAVRQLKRAEGVLGRLRRWIGG